MSAYDDTGPTDVAALVEEALNLDKERRTKWGTPTFYAGDESTWRGHALLLAAALAAQERDLAAAHDALNGHASTGMPLAKRIAAALGTHAHDIAELQRRLEAVRDAGVLALRIATAERAEARGRAAFHEEQSRIRGERLDAIGEAIGYGPGWEGLAGEVEGIVEQRDAATARAEKAEAALAKVAERLAMATRFNAGDGVTVEKVHVAGSNEMEWRIIGALRAHGASLWAVERDGYPDVDAALAALVVSRG